MPKDLGGSLARGFALFIKGVFFLEGVTLNSDCNLRQGARHLKGTYKGDVFTYLFRFFGSIWAHKGPYGPIWARMGPYGSGPGPSRAGKVHLFQ